jgi:hypothetical protein
MGIKIEEVKKPERIACFVGLTENELIDVVVCVNAQADRQREFGNFNEAVKLKNLSNKIKEGYTS